jgi:hypothetical protein
MKYRVLLLVHQHAVLAKAARPEEAKAQFGRLIWLHRPHEVYSTLKVFFSDCIEINLFV